MHRRQLKFVILGLGILVSMGFLLVVGMSRPGGFAYYVTVSEFLDQPQRSGAGIRVNGKVVSGSIERLASGMDVRFTMSDGASSLPVRYHGIIPDTFVDDADVVVEGALAEGQVFTADVLLAKCPSKYESADGAEIDYGAEQQPPATGTAAQDVATGAP